MLVRSSSKAPDLLWSEWGGQHTGDVGFGRLSSGKMVLIVEEQMSGSDTDCTVTTVGVVDASRVPIQELSTSRESDCSE